MTAIDDKQEFARDWDWYAVDPDGNIGHFTTAGLRPLPKSVKQDLEAAEALDEHFQERAVPVGGSLIREAVEADAGGWKNSTARERYLKSFDEMAQKGLFSYNTQLVHSTDAKYYLVARPEKPLRAADLPGEVRNLLERTRSPVRFGETVYLPEATTETW